MIDHDGSRRKLTDQLQSRRQLVGVNQQIIGVSPFEDEFQPPSEFRLKYKKRIRFTLNDVPESHQLPVMLPGIQLVRQMFVPQIHPAYYAIYKCVFISKIQKKLG